MFRRRKGEPATGSPDPDLEVESASEAQEEVVAPEPTGVTFDRSSGPYDVTELPEEDGLTRLDLGALRLAVYEGMELRLDLDEETSVVQSATVVINGSAMQLMAFAAPRLDGIWDETRGEIAVGIGGSGGTVDDVEGSLGAELHALLPAEGPDGKPAMMPLRFAGIDGPRWFLRAMFTGAAAREPEAAGPLEAVLRACVVVRGRDPMAPGDGLPLHVPTDVPEGFAPGTPPATASDAADEDAPAERAPLLPPRRGPEITEIH